MRLSALLVPHPPSTNVSQYIGSCRSLSHDRTETSSPAAGAEPEIHRVGPDSGPTLRRL
jgi:hypothetical protein